MDRGDTRVLVQEIGFGGGAVRHASPD